MRFGLVSVGEWSGIPIQEIIKLAQPTAKAKAILINGFDDDSRLPQTRASVPDAFLADLQLDLHV